MSVFGFCLFRHILPLLHTGYVTGKEIADAHEIEEGIYCTIELEIILLFNMIWNLLLLRFGSVTALFSTCKEAFTAQPDFWPLSTIHLASKIQTTLRHCQTVVHHMIPIRFCWLGHLPATSTSAVFCEPLMLCYYFSTMSPMLLCDHLLLAARRSQGETGDTPV